MKFGTRARVALWSAAILFCFGAIHVIMTCLELSPFPGAGLMAIMNDPGKALFDLLVLPIAVAVLVIVYPRETLKAIGARPWAVWVCALIAVILAGLVVWYVEYDARIGFGEELSSGGIPDTPRLPVPADLGNADARQHEG